jgi:hypothetical protein
MYESITYAELKKLPSAEKPEAWKELKSLYSTQKELAEKLGVSAALVYNMISRYVKDKPAESKKTEVLEVVPEPKKARRRVKKQDKQERDKEQQEQEIIVIETNPIVPEVKDVEEDESFSIAIKKTVSGEDAQFFLSGIGNTLLKNQKYVIAVKITEK